MSTFPKAQLKRFNERTGCAPPVGVYDPKDGTKVAGGILEKSERFKHPKDTSDGNLGVDSVLAFSTPSLSSTPIKGANKFSSSSSSAESLVHSMSKKSCAKKPAPLGEHQARIKELELEVRGLLREKSDKDKELQKLRQEHEKLEGRLNSANAERSNSLARSAQLEQEARDAKRGLEVLQKQINNTESSGRRKEDKLKEEVQGLQHQIHSKDQEIRAIHKQIVQALLDLLSDAERCTKHSEGLAPLFCRLELGSVMTESEDEDKVAVSDSESGLKQSFSQIKKVRRLIKRVSACVSKLVECGVDKLDGIESRLEEDYHQRLQCLSSQLADAHLQHQQLQQLLAQQQQQHQQCLAELLQQHQEECDSLQLEIKQLQQNCEQAQQHLQQTLQDYTAVQQRLQQSEKEHQSIVHQMQQDHDSLQSRLTQEQCDLETLLKEEQEALEYRLREEQATLECRLEESQEQRVREVGEVEERCQQMQNQVDVVHEKLRLKEAKLKELEDNLLKVQTEHNAACEAVQEELQQLQEKLTVAEEDVLHKQMQHDEALLQLHCMQESQEKMQGQLQESYDCRILMQQQVQHLQQEKFCLQELVDNLQKNRESLELTSETAKKELELKQNLMSDALQNLTAEAYTTTETGTPTKTQQVLFETMAEKAAVQEHMQQLDEENKILNSSIKSLTEKYQNVVRELEQELAVEREKSSQMEARFTTSEDEREKVKEELNQTQLANRNLLQRLNIYKDEVSCLKMNNDDTKKAMEGLSMKNTDLQADIKTLQLRLEEEQQATDDARREAETRILQLEVENKQHQIINETLKGKVTYLTDTHNKEIAELRDTCHGLQQEKQKVVEKYQEDLQSVRHALALDRKTNDLQMEELNLKLERAQAFNAQMKEELKKLLKDKEKLKDDSRAELAALQVKVQTAEAQVTEANNQLDLSRHQAKHAQAECLKLKSLVAELEPSLASWQKEVEQLQAEKEALEEHINRISGEHSVLQTDLEEQLHSVQAAALEERAAYERIIGEMSEKIQQLEEEQELNRDSDEWRLKYEELFARVEPFMEQLDAFAAERNLLVGRSEMVEAEMAKMMDKYAKLLGHQNQKQKIQYINKLKDEYMQCRKEKDALKEKSNKMQNTIQRLEKKIQTLEGRKTFDPAQAFKHAASRKEDDPKAVSKLGDPAHALKQAGRQNNVARSPLRQSNK